MEDLIRVLEKTISNVQADQNEAVKYIQEFNNRDPIGFLKVLSDVLSDPNNSPVSRTAAGLQLKTQLTARDGSLKASQQERWRSLPEDARLYIRERVFRTLGTEAFKPSSSPQCVAYIALVELPERLWPDLIQALTHNVTNPSSTSQLRLASLEAIGYICQEIDQSCLQPSDSDLILTAIVDTGMRDVDNEIRTAATTALMHISEHKVIKVSKSRPDITFDELGSLLNVDPDHAERIVAQMIREDRIKGHLNQIERIVHFDAKEVLQLFDEAILHLCSDVNDIVEKIQAVVPEEWWAANASS